MGRDHAGLLAEPTDPREDAVEGGDRLHGSRKRSNHMVVDPARCDERKEDGDMRGHSPR